MIRIHLRRLASKKDKFDHLLEKYNLPRSFFNINRKMVSNGFFIGLFWAFIPMPMQMLAVVLTGSIFRFNIIIAFAMVWLSNPLTMPFMYYVEYLTGNFILGMEKKHEMELTLEWFSNNFDNIFVPLYVGALFYSIFVSVSMYFLINHLWIKSVLKEKKNKNKTL